MSDEPDVTEISDEPTVVEGDSEVPEGADESPAPTSDDWPDWSTANLVRQTSVTEWEVVGPLPGAYDAFHNGERIRAGYGEFLARPLMNPAVVVSIGDPRDLGEPVNVAEELGEEPPKKRPASRAKKGQGS